MANTNYPHLFSPLQLGGVELRNRVALPATLTNYARASRVTERWKNFLVARAYGGTALIVTEIIAVDPHAIAHQAIVSGFDAQNEPGLSATAHGVHAAGSHIVGQLWHPGRQQLWQPSHSPMGVSDQPDAYSWTVPHVMSDADLDRLVDAYASTAERLHRCGFDGVELHGAHGYLITQLLSPWSNTRNGRYGGSQARRAEFCLAVAREIRTRVPTDFVVGLKMPAREGVDGGIDPKEAVGLTTLLSASGLFSYFAYGQGNFSISLEDHVPDMHYTPGHFIDLHRQMRTAAAGVPVMALGRIGDAALAERVVAEGFGDLVGTSRAQIADANWANKVSSAQLDKIRPSVYNNFCWGEVHAGKPLEEFHNPEIGLADEHMFALAKASTARRIAVVGAGPAGLECAWKAAARGHHVTLFGDKLRAGGKLHLEAALPGHGEMSRVIEYQLSRAREFGVSFQLGKRASAPDLSDFDAVVLATGSEFRLPEVESDGSTPSISVHDLARRIEMSDLPSGTRAVLFDFDHTAPTYAAVLALADAFHEVILLTPRTHVAQAVNYCSALGIHRRLHTAEVDIRTATIPIKVGLHGVRTRNIFSHKLNTIDDVDLFVYATPRVANDSLQAQLEGREVHLVGDCMAPRNLMMAIHEGHAVALQL
jgi:dimethylglycine catabolism A